MQTVAHSASERGELYLCRRTDGTLELRVNGVYVMDSVETSTETLLARIALDRLRGKQSRVLIGGLGLGFTLAAVLADDTVTDVVVAEIEPELVGWHRDGVIPAPGPADARSPLADSRVHIEVGDVRDVVSRLARASVDAILLDVDNGPGFLVYDANAGVYAPDFLRTCSDALALDGVLAVWTSAASRSLLVSMRAVFDRVKDCETPVRLGRRTTSYHVYIGYRLP